MLRQRISEAAGALEQWASHGVQAVGIQGGRAVCGSWAMASALSPGQVLEERQRLWLAELKRLYLERLHEVTQKAERSERNLQLQLFMAQQEQRRLRKELRAQQGLGPEPRPPGSLPEADPSARAEEEARWEVRDQAFRDSCPHYCRAILCLPSDRSPPYPALLGSCLSLSPFRCARKQRRSAS